jgi:hypothetical protein
VTAQPRDSVDVGTSFAVWPPPTVSRVDPFHFGIRTGADKPRGPRLNPYVERDIDHHLQLLLEHHQQAIVVSASHGAGAARTVYEALKRVHPRARLLIPMPPGEFAPEVLSTTNIEGSVVLWLDTLGSYWGVEGARLFEVLSRWVRQPDRWLIATVYDGDPDVFASKEFDLLNARVLRLDSELTQRRARPHAQALRRRKNDCLHRISPSGKERPKNPRAATEARAAPARARPAARRRASRANRRST